MVIAWWRVEILETKYYIFVGDFWATTLNNHTAQFETNERWNSDEFKTYSTCYFCDPHNFTANFSFLRFNCFWIINHLRAGTFEWKELKVLLKNIFSRFIHFSTSLSRNTRNIGNRFTNSFIIKIFLRR